MYVHFAGRQDLSRTGLRDQYKGVPENLLGIQYWFYYPYNYFPVGVARGLIDRQPLAAVKHSEGLHEGDWEQVTVFLSDELVPQWLFMARHADEGVAIRWDQLAFDGHHPIVQAAFGGHPTYPADCAGRPRNRVRNQLADYLSCGSGRFAFRGGRTPLANLGRAPWACWRGLFGEKGPRAPLRQPPNNGVCQGGRRAGEREILKTLASIKTDGSRKP